MSMTPIDALATGSMVQIKGLNTSTGQVQTVAQQVPDGDSGSGVSGGSDPSFGDIVQQLQQLASGEPTQFKSQTADIASRMSSVAGQSSGLTAQLFQSLASEFQAAAQSGEAPKLQLTYSHGMHHHHARAATSTSNSSASSSASAASATGASTSQIPKNADGTYGPEHATDQFTAEVQAGAVGKALGQIYWVGNSICEVV